MSFGTGPYGLGPYGGGLASVSVSYAWATSTRSVRVVFTGPVLALDEFATGDALNPSSWALTREDTGAALTVLAARANGAHTEIDLDLLDQLGNQLVTHEVDASAVLDAGGATIVTPKTADTHSHVVRPQEMEWQKTRFPGCEAKTLLFEPATRFPMATEYRVEVPAGTRSAVGGALSAAARWTFGTPAPVLETRFPADAPARRGGSRRGASASCQSCSPP